jgi:phosphoribosylamine--glycine ligase
MVLEYNVRFGDPECQPLLMRLDSDLAAVMLACIDGTLDPARVLWKPETAACVVMAAEGYPGSYAKGLPISGIDRADALPGVKVFQGGTRLDNGQPVTSGGRVLGVTALGGSLAQARDRAYEACAQIDFKGAHYRRDIGDKGLRRL